MTRTISRHVIELCPKFSSLASFCSFNAYGDVVLDPDFYDDVNDHEPDDRVFVLLYLTYLMFTDDMQTMIIDKCGPAIIKHLQYIVSKDPDQLAHHIGNFSHNQSAKRARHSGDMQSMRI